MTGGRRICGAACVAALALAGCASAPPDEDPVQIKLTDLDTRVARIERVVANQSLLDLSNQLEALRSDVRALRNAVDQLNHNAETDRKQQRALYADLDQRLKNLEPRGAGPAVGGAPAAPTGADAAAKISYQAAFDLLKNNQYDRAIGAFQNFLASYPTSALAENAQYWLGEAYYVNRAFPESLAAFQRVVDDFPGSRKIPDALLKIGYCDYELKQFATAQDVLAQVTEKYPDTPAGHLAQQRLQKIAAEQQ